MYMYVLYAYVSLSPSLLYVYVLACMYVYYSYYTYTGNIYTHVSYVKSTAFSRCSVKIRQLSSRSFPFLFY